jgi:hypothetical protein
MMTPATLTECPACAFVMMWRLVPGQALSLLRAEDGKPRRKTATQVAEWAGHSAEVLLTIYAKCIEGRDQVWFDRIDRWLGNP